jgi:uncharacterized ferritin-like protein (DUF455 family)
MTVVDPADTMVIRGVTLRRDPAREQCFTVVHLRSELRRSSDAPEAWREGLHEEFNNEVQNLEVAAQSLADFPDAPWELRMQLARQCWDETRHARFYFDRFVDMGGYKGEFPIVNQQWSVVCMLDSLPARLAIQNRTFEGGSMDLFREWINKRKEAGDERAAELIETIVADEIQHVRFANQWLKRMGRENPRVLIKVAGAVTYLKRINAALAPQVGDVDIEGRGYSVVAPTISSSTEDRRLAEFTEEEIAETLRQEGLGSLVPRPTPSDVKQTMLSAVKRCDEGQ